VRFIFLGTGTSSGVPAVACSCAVCTSSDPRDNRLRAGAAVEFTDATGQRRVVLIDATPDLRQQALRAGLTRCDAVLFTHNHVDHTFGVDELRRFNAVQRAPIDIYAEPHTLEHLRRVYRHIFERERNVQDSFVASLIPHAIRMPDVPREPAQPAAPVSGRRPASGESEGAGREGWGGWGGWGGAGEPIDLFGLRFTPIRLLHGRLPVVGFRIERATAERAPVGGADAAGSASPPLPLAYCTDVSAIPPKSWRYLSGLDTLVLDALRHRKHPTHFTVEEAVGAAAQIGARRTWFTHMSHDLPHEATDAALPEGMRLAYDGLVIEAAAEG
jgi:phosphoribosyl 1,2-cyclic phosphate phosphodiesterase